MGKVRVILNLAKINTAASCTWQGRNDGGGGGDTGRGRGSERGLTTR